MPSGRKKAQLSRKSRSILKPPSCTRHHTLVHEGGFRIDRDFRDNWTFFRPDGIAVPDCGYHARDMVDDDTGGHYDNPPRGGLLSAMEKLVNEPPAPNY